MVREDTCWLTGSEVIVVYIEYHHYGKSPLINALTEWLMKILQSYEI